MLKGFSRNFKPLNILTENEVEHIHQSVVKVLREVGIQFDYEEALRFFKKNDCIVDFENRKVKFPEEIIMECIHKCPSSFRLRARNPENDLMIGANTVYFLNFPGMQTIDMDTLLPRSPSRKEYYDMITIFDALENLHTISGYPYFGFEGIIDPLMILPECMAGKIRNSDKTLWADYDKDSEIFIIEMAKVVNTELVGICTASPPLRYTKEAFLAAKRFVEADFPMALLSGCVQGVNGPATIAGSLITDTAELLAGVILIQLMRPGTGVITNNFSFPANMRTGYHDFGGIGRCLHQAASNQIWRFYSIPKWNGAVGISNSKSIDFQNGCERTMAAMIGALSGANIIQLHSGIYGELTAHPIQAILDDDIAGLIGRFIEGAQITEPTLALDLIREVGSNGTYLDKEHTRDWWKKEGYIPKVFDTLSFQKWEIQGKKDSIKYAEERMNKILSEHKVKKPLSDKEEESIMKILNDVNKYYGINKK